MKKTVQIDVLRIDKTILGDVAVCNLYTPSRCVKIGMTAHDYLCLVSEGFFLRDGTWTDSAGVVNTTETYAREEEQRYYIFASGADCDGVPVSEDEAVRGPFLKSFAESYCEELQESGDGIRYVVVDAEQIFQLTAGEYPADTENGILRW